MRERLSAAEGEKRRGKRTASLSGGFQPAFEREAPKCRKGAKGFGDGCAAARLAESRADADLHYLLGDALAYVGQRMNELDGQPANGLSAD